MILDAHALFDDDRDVGVTVQELTSTNVLDFAVAGIDAGAPLEVLIQFTEAVTSAGAATIQVKVYTDSAEGFGTEVLLAQTGLMAIATMVLGYQVPLNVVPRSTDRYMRLKYDIATATTTAGTLTAGIILDNQDGVTAT